MGPNLACFLLMPLRAGARHLGAAAQRRPQTGRRPSARQRRQYAAAGDPAEVRDAGPKGRDGFALRDFERGDVILQFERRLWWTNFASH